MQFFLRKVVPFLRQLVGLYDLLTWRMMEIKMLLFRVHLPLNCIKIMVLEILH